MFCHRLLRGAGSLQPASKSVPTVAINPVLSESRLKTLRGSKALGKIGSLAGFLCGHGKLPASAPAGKSEEPELCSSLFWDHPHDHSSYCVSPEEWRAVTLDKKMVLFDFATQQWKEASVLRAEAFCTAFFHWPITNSVPLFSVYTFPSGPIASGV
jgi:hypothetical protein